MEVGSPEDSEPVQPASKPKYNDDDQTPTMADAIKNTQLKQSGELDPVMNTLMKMEKKLGKLDLLDEIKNDIKSIKVDIQTVKDSSEANIEETKTHETIIVKLE